MSATFWIKLVSALTLFGVAIVAVQLYKSEMVRDLRARLLRRKIVPLVGAMLPIILVHAASRDTGISILADDYRLMCYRADLEAFFKQAKPLFDQERTTIESFLSSLSVLAFQADRGHIEHSDLENSVLLGQRIVQEFTEIGL